MIWVSLLSLVFFLVNLVIGIFPSIPDIPVELSSAISNLFDLLFNNAGFVGFFLPMNIVKIAIPIVIILVNFKYIYHCIMWIVRKLPISTD